MPSVTLVILDGSKHRPATADVAGKIIVPPGFAAVFAVASGAGTTPLYGITAAWSEIASEIDF